MKTISILSAGFLAMSLYAFAPETKPIPSAEKVITLVEQNSRLIKLNNEFLKDRLVVPDQPQVSYIDYSSYIAAHKGDQSDIEEPVSGGSDGSPE